MSMKPLHDNVAIAIDGGGIKGLIIAKALARLERELGDKPLIEHPSIKVLAGTSTGSVISAGLAIGLRAEKIAEIYSLFGREVFPPLSPTWLPNFIRKADEFMRMLLQHSLYPSENVVKFLRKVIGEQTQMPDMTLGELNARLGPDKAIVFTAVNIDERRTYFIKSYKDYWSDWKLWEAVLASSAAPVALPVFPHADPGGKIQYFTDGGAGSYGNPAYVATQEAIVFRGYAPKDVSVLSFGTGWVDPANFQRDAGKPTGWHGLDWAMNAPILLLGDAARTQSLDIITDFADQGLDFRRFQFPLEKDIAGDAFADKATYDQMVQIGLALGENISNNLYAPNQDPRYDPERLWDVLDRYQKSMK